MNVNIASKQHFKITVKVWELLPDRFWSNLVFDDAFNLLYSGNIVIFFDLIHWYLIQFQFSSVLFVDMYCCISEKCIKYLTKLQKFWIKLLYELIKFYVKPKLDHQSQVVQVWRTTKIKSLPFGHTSLWFTKIEYPSFLSSYHPFLSSLF